MGTRRYKKLFVIATEGAITEPQYFHLLNSLSTANHIQVIKGRHDSAPPHVLRRMEAHLLKSQLSSDDEAWIVVDRDSWPRDQLDELADWEEKSPHHGLAVSNPNFEYWLLLHFENCQGAITAKECLKRLRTHLPHYDKTLRTSDFDLNSMRLAVTRAKAKNEGTSERWPTTAGTTTVYRLVHKMLS